MSPSVSQIRDSRLPVTLLSGFLGSGKTTLLQHILKSKDHGLKCAVLVNDMGAINIDGALVEKGQLIQTDEKVVQMQNGCICCTLREDLLQEIAALAKARSFDYLIIESTGISEPMQVAETFTTDFSTAILELDEQHREQDPLDISDKMNTTPEISEGLAKLLRDGGLSKLARLDTCVTMIDCFNIFDNLDTHEFLSDRYGAAVDPEDERNITDLFVDQIEFANIIILDKCDTVPTKQVGRARALCKRLNPSATIIESTFSKIDLTQILNTNKFDFEEAAAGSGWLKSLQEMQAVEKDGKMRFYPTPETEEYNISSFVYRARRPFHPERLWTLIKEFFIVQQFSVEDDEDDESEDGSESQSPMDVDDSASSMSEDESETEPEIDVKERLAAKRAHPIWSTLLRSKGFLWLATRPLEIGDWSQAGGLLTFRGAGIWFASLPEDDWPTEQSTIDSIKADFQGEWGDRRQELVFIGENLNVDGIKKSLDEVLLTDGEWRQWVNVMRRPESEFPMDKKLRKLGELFEDGFEEWTVLEQDEHGHRHNDQ